MHEPAFVLLKFDVWVADKYEFGSEKNCYTNYVSRNNVTLFSNDPRYIAVCFPLLHRDLAYTYSVSTRVVCYTVPVLIISILVNVPKFMETKIVVETSWKTVQENTNNRNLVVDDGGSGGIAKSSYMNVTTYTIDVTDLR